MKCITKITIIGLIAVLASCGSTQQIAINTMEPAQVNLSNEIVRVGVVNKVVQNEGANLGNGIDRLVAIEDQWLITKGQDAAVNSLVEELRKDNRFEVESLDASNSDLESFHNDSNAVAWDKIKTICEENNIDALFSLTHFDAETSVSLRKTKMEQLNMLREKESVPGQEITLETLIHNGWRIYDPTHEKIIDEYTYDQQIISRAKGTDPIAALRAIGSRKDSILFEGNLAGNAYGGRLKPSTHKIFREYYVKGTDKLVQAGKIMASGDVQAAAKLWKEEVSNPNIKIEGRACHNLAVGTELEGNLTEALEWASKANEILNDKTSQGYVEELEDRLSQQMIVDKQLAQLKFDD